ncbi:SDR family oxidoreductase [Polluticoccus soli]|uniref:SDR family oxidoreductase n=1 Tax=Polluticoccus soli TaxID=3034150 RepID=UPI0023E2635C|nr:SDR family oxidoreductase [Flavipsychrobacter sp. JY13-12]
MDTLKDKVVVITGASSGIGKALALLAADQGAKIAVCGRNAEKLTEAFGQTNDNRLIMAADVSKEADCKAFIEAALNKWGRVDVLINNAGITMRALFEDVDISVIKELMDINFWGTVYCTKYALPSIRRNKGVIVGVSSIAGFRGLPARTGYSASKFAMQGFLEALRTELLETGAHVMWVSPGFTSSNIRNVARSADGSSQGETPLDEGKLMSAEECAGIILDAVKKRKRTVIMTGQGKLTVWLNKLFAGFADKLVYKHFLNEPNSPLHKYRNEK